MSKQSGKYFGNDYKKFEEALSRFIGSGFSLALLFEGLSSVCFLVLTPLKLATFPETLAFICYILIKHIPKYRFLKFTFPRDISA